MNKYIRRMAEDLWRFNPRRVHPFRAVPLGDWQAAFCSSHRRVRIAQWNFFSNNRAARPSRYTRPSQYTRQSEAECPQSVCAPTSPKWQKMPAQPARQITQMPHVCLIRYATVKLKGQRRTPNRLESTESQSAHLNARSIRLHP